MVNAESDHGNFFIQSLNKILALVGFLLILLVNMFGLLFLMPNISQKLEVVNFFTKVLLLLFLLSLFIELHTVEMFLK